MKVLLQRVNSASVEVEKEIVGQISKGVLLFLGIGKNDIGEEIEWLTDKIVNMRIFEEGEKCFDKSLIDVGGEALVVSQFTLCGACERGRRPDFFAAAEPFRAKELYERFVQTLKDKGVTVATGQFGAYMKVKLENDGPVTFLLEK